MRIPKICHLICLALLVSCADSPKGYQDIVKNKEDLDEINQGDTVRNNGLLFSIKNLSNISIMDVQISLPDTLLFFKHIKPKSKTDWITIKSSYSYSDIKLIDSLNNYYHYQIKDFVGESLYVKGCMTFILDSFDNKTKTFKFMSNQK